MSMEAVHARQEKRRQRQEQHAARDRAAEAAEPKAKRPRKQSKRYRHNTLAAQAARGLTRKPEESGDPRQDVALAYKDAHSVQYTRPDPVTGEQVDATTVETPDYLRAPDVKTCQMMARLAWTQRLGFLCDMVDGKLRRKVTFVNRFEGKFSTVTIDVEPTFAERQEAMRELGKLGQVDRPLASVGSADPDGPGGSSDPSSAAIVSRTIHALAELANTLAGDRRAPPSLAAVSAAQTTSPAD